MTRRMHLTAMVGLLMIVTSLSLAALLEPSRLATATSELYSEMVAEGTDLYAQNCVACHGASGEGLASYPPLDSAAAMDAEVLYKTIDRGRFSTAMAAFGVEEGGILTAMQIESLTVALQAETWDVVAARVAELGLTPPQITVAEIPEETLAQIAAMPDGDVLAAGFTTYAANCAACHGANGEGTTVAPALNTDELRVRVNESDLTRIISTGVPGTLMASWSSALDPSELQSVVTLISRWGEIDTMGVVLPAIEPAPLDLSPEAIASGKQLFSLLCTQCHGADGYGSPIAPALNNQTFLNQTPDAAIQAIIAGGVSGTSMPSWSGYLTDADIAAITSYLRSMEASAPVVVPAQP